MTLDGYFGVVYINYDEDYRFDVWWSNVWDTPGAVLDEMWEENSDLLSSIAGNSEHFSDYDSDDIQSHQVHTKQLKTILAKVRRRLKPSGIEVEYKDICFSIRRIPIHLSQIAR